MLLTNLSTDRVIKFGVHYSSILETDMVENNSSRTITDFHHAAMVHNVIVSSLCKMSVEIINVSLHKGSIVVDELGELFGSALILREVLARWAILLVADNEVS